jgi:arylsulfatase A-like enzyme
VAAPGLKGGRTVDALLQPVDIVPTLLDLAGLQVDPPQPFHGRSFAPMMRRRRQKPLREAAICASFLRARDGKLPPNASTPGVFTEKWFYTPIGPRGAEELSALRTDPLAEKNVASQHPEVCEHLRKYLLDWMAGIGAPAEAIEALRSHPAKKAR